MTEKDVVAKDLVVSLEYTLWVDNEVLDTSKTKGREPIQFIQGNGEIIPGLEKEIDGMALNEPKEVFVKSQDAYGEYDPEDVTSLPKDEFPNDFPMSEGVEVEVRDRKGENRPGRIIKLEGEEMQIDFNHPLAGKDLRFEVEVVALRSPSEQEIAHGHVHGHGDH